VGAELLTGLWRRGVKIRKKRTAAVVGALSAVVAVTLAAAPDAFAATCSSSYQRYGPLGHYYSAENSAQAYAGMEGGQAPSSLTWNGATFIINWLGGFGGAGCNPPGRLLGACSLQAGYGRGDVGGTTSSGTQYYAEEQDVNGYLPRFYATPSSWFVTNVGWSGAYSSSGAYGRWDAYVSPSTGGHILLESSYFPVSNGAFWNEQAATQTEVAYASSGTCAQCHVAYFDHAA